MACDCKFFCFKLAELCHEILGKGDERTQWKMFEEFLVKYIRDSFGTKLGIYLCSLEICSSFVDKLPEFRRLGITLSSLFVDLIPTLYFEECGRSSLHLIWDFEKTTPFSNSREILRGLFALMRGMKQYMKLLVNLGLLSSLSADSPYLIKGLEIEFYIFIRCTNNNSDISDEDDIHGEDVSHEVISSVTEQAIQLLKIFFFHHDVKKPHKRMYLAINALNAIRLNLQKEYMLAERFISCLKMYFIGTPDAFLSIFEVRSILYSCFKLTNKLHLFDMYCQELYRLIPECPVKMEPRKLTHLARCQIRKNIKASHLSLPSAIDKLHLPNILKNFLLGKVDDLSRKRENVSSQKPVNLVELDLLLSGQTIN